jgi:hypothetical protein
VATTAAKPTIAPTIEPTSAPTFNMSVGDGDVDVGDVDVGVNEDRDVGALEELMVVSGPRFVEVVNEGTLIVTCVFGKGEDVVNDKSCAFHRIWIGQAICHHV